MDNYHYIFDSVNISKNGVIFEVGSRDALDSVTLHKYFKCKVFCFEANPFQHEIIKENIKPYGDQIKLVPFGVMEKEGDMAFNRVINQSGNIGSSSFLDVDFSWREYDRKNAEAREAITVSTIRLDTFIDNNSLPKVDLMCIDVEGAELQVLKSLGNKVNDIKYISVETAFNSPFF